MFRILMQLWENYGLDAVQIGIIVGLVWKFATNHWRHLTNDVKEIKLNVKDNRKDINSLTERVAKVEGKTE